VLLLVEEARTGRQPCASPPATATVEAVGATATTASFSSGRNQSASRLSGSQIPAPENCDAVMDTDVDLLKLPVVSAAVGTAAMAVGPPPSARPGSSPGDWPQPSTCWWFC
jgi:hypothetical protein